MRVLPPVLHTGARPIHVTEFVDAVRATCPPRFPRARGGLARQVGIAISGGVDSMALAHLCSQVRQYDNDFRISDNPTSSFRAFIVDHRLRDNSYEEALAVYFALLDMGIKSHILGIKWAEILTHSRLKHPVHLPNVETFARRLRYRALGEECGFRRVASLIVAHHEDDQYETVLMRMLRGHRSRGLRGMKKATGIPECDDLFGVSRSGYVDDQNQPEPYYSNKMNNKERKKLRQELTSDFYQLKSDAELDDDTLLELDARAAGYYQTPQKSDPVEAFDIDVEDGGVFVYRPLLEFSKDRLIATCLANNVPWFEDPTNHNRTLTLRNAVRHMYKGYTLPVALQKPAILDLAKRCEQKAQRLDAEANRLLSRTIIRDFKPNSGTLTIQFPDYGLPRTRRYARSSIRRQARLSRRREVAGRLIQKIMTIVSPESQLIPWGNIQNIVPRLFPTLVEPRDVDLLNDPKAFVTSNVFSVPIELDPQQPYGAFRTSNLGGKQLGWFLSRAPYDSSMSVPRFRPPYWAPEDKLQPDPCRRWPWSKWSVWSLWDGRFWVRVLHRFPYRVVVQPFDIEHSKVFRERLHPRDRDRLALLLKKYAPGKVRYTLPAIYVDEDVDLDNMVTRPGYPCPASPNKTMHPRIIDTSKMKLLALPTLHIQIPGADEWLAYEIRFRHVDRDILETAGKYYRGAFARFKSRLKTKPKLGRDKPRAKILRRMREKTGNTRTRVRREAERRVGASTGVEYVERGDERMCNRTG